MYKGENKVYVCTRARALHVVRQNVKPPQVIKMQFHHLMKTI